MKPLLGLMAFMLVGDAAAGAPRAGVGAAQAPVCAATAPAARTFHGQIAAVNTDDLPESSGIVASRINRAAYWTHNDSGPAHPRVWALGLTDADRSRRIARVLGWVELAGASNVDWEDIAAGPGGHIYILDGGDNPPCNRTDKRIHRFVEPTLDVDAPRPGQRLAFETIRFEYPDPRAPTRPAGAMADRYDAESLLVHPMSGDVYIVTKRNHAGRLAARVYRLAGAGIRWDLPEAIHVLALVADLTRTVRRVPGPLELANMITGGDIDAGGGRVVLRDYLTALEFYLPPGAPFERVFEQRPRMISLVGELQGEAICYSRDGCELVSTSEMKEFRLTRCPVFVTPCTSAPAAAHGF